ncbi:hypothetical protein MKW92_007507, partial [Papaver armeniacum]
MHWFLFDEFAEQFNDLGTHGTKVIVYNLWFTEDGEMELNFESDVKDSLALMGRIDLQKSHASGHSTVAWCGARSAKMVEALNYMNK